VDVARRDAGEVNPFALLALRDDPTELAQVTRNYARRVSAEVAALPRLLIAARARSPHERLRIGYLSGHFHSHATAYLTAEMFECHDRGKFEVIGYSFGPDENGPMRNRLRQAVEHFVDLRSVSMADAAARIADDEIDILVDLMGYTQGARTGILALRPAPIQVAYLGYPGPMGSAYADYTMVDRYVVPPDQERFYDEKLVILPGCYQPNDSRREIAAAADRRGDHGLSENGFVFCCFNQPYKITAEVFGWWIGLLLETPGSVLWLLAFNEDMQGRLPR